jgi:hypothetical protein
MRKALFWVVLVAALTILAVAAYVASKRTSTSDDTAYRAFREVIYFGTLDARRGVTLRIGCARWSTEADAAAFAEGVQNS